jgi:hypothetical protein
MKNLLSFRLPPVICLLVAGLSQNWLLASDVKTYVIEKGIQFIQTDTGTPLADSNNGVIFDTTVKATDSNLVTSATLLLPNGVTLPVPQDASDEFKLKKKYNKQTTLDANFPDGQYSLSVTTLHDGAKTLLLPLVGDGYPNTPRISNFSATQVIDAGAYCLFTWDPFTGGGTNDFVQLHIEDNQGNKIWETPDVGEAGAFDGRATAALVPPRTFLPAQTCQAYLYFAKASAQDRTTYPGAVGFSGFYKRTKLAIQTVAAASQADVKFYTLSKSRRFTQTDSGSPILQTNKTFNLDAEVDAATAGTVTTVGLVLPSKTVQTLDPQSDNKTFAINDNSITQNGLDSLYADGSYAFDITTTSTSKMPVLILSGDAYPAPPHVLNFPGNVDPTSDLLVSWEPFTGGTVLDFIQFHVEDLQGNKVFETPNYGKNGAFNGTALQVILPRNTLTAGRSYNARVVFQKDSVLDTTSYPGALGVASYATRTYFPLTTTGGVPQPPSLAAIPASNGNGFQFLVQAGSGQTIRLDASSDLRQWIPISTNSVPAAGQFQFTDSQSSSINRRYYRAVLLP